MEGMQAEWAWACAMLLRNSLQETPQQRQKPDASQANSASVWDFGERMTCVRAYVGEGKVGGGEDVHALEVLLEKAV